MISKREAAAQLSFSTNKNGGVRRRDQLKKKMVLGQWLGKQHIIYMLLYMYMISFPPFTFTLSKAFIKVVLMGRTLGDCNGMASFP